ncbi:MAG: hypothetical protein LBN26_09295 [Christensenellaceae bacterium]|jgi:hypothetical protein|nr:hypothetical protein [Christensenellaceae bacterium]
MRTAQLRKVLRLIVFSCVCTLLFTGCFRTSDNLRLEYGEDGMHLYVDGIEYVERFSSETLWDNWSNHDTAMESEPECIGQVVATIRNKKIQYDVYRYKDFQDFIFTMPRQTMFDFELLPLFHFFQKDIVFPELSANTVNHIGILRSSDLKLLGITGIENNEVISKVLAIINGKARVKDNGWENFYIMLTSDAVPGFASWHSISENNGQYYIQVAPGNNYAPIPRELLEEIIGGPLPVKP